MSASEEAALGHQSAHKNAQVSSLDEQSQHYIMLVEDDAVRRSADVVVVDRRPKIV